MGWLRWPERLSIYLRSRRVSRRAGPASVGRNLETRHPGRALKGGNRSAPSHLVADLQNVSPLATISERASPVAIPAATSRVRESHLHGTRTVYAVTGTIEALWHALSRVERKVWSRRTAFGGRRVQVVAESGYDDTFTAVPSKGRVANHLCEWLGLLVTRVDRREGWGSSAARECLRCRSRTRGCGTAQGREVSFGNRGPGLLWRMFPVRR